MFKKSLKLESSQSSRPSRNPRHDPDSFHSLKRKRDHDPQSEDEISLPSFSDPSNYERDYWATKKVTYYILIILTSYYTYIYYLINLILNIFLLSILA